MTICLLLFFPPSPLHISTLIDLNLSINLPNKNISRIKPNRPRQNPKSQHQQNRIAKIQQSRHKSGDFQFRVKIEDGIKKDVESAASRNNKATPPPVIIF